MVRGFFIFLFINIAATYFLPRTAFFYIRYGMRTHVLDEYPSSYITDEGDIYSAYGRKRKLTVNRRSGYLQVGVYDDNRKYKMLYVHRLVAKYFVPNPEGYRNVVHLDGDKENNNADNLVWARSRVSLRRKDEGYYEEG